MSARNLSLKSFFYPKSIVIVGASKNPNKVGGIVLNNILYSEFQGEIFLVNPNSVEIANQKCYPTVLEVPVICDLAVVAVSAEVVLAVFKQIIQKGIKNVVIFTSGFKEIGSDGELLEKKIKELAVTFNINLLGPNCLGFVNNDISLNLTFSAAPAKPGNLNFISQSGAIASSFFDFCFLNNLGFNFFTTLGNKAGLNEVSILDFWRRDFLDNCMVPCPIGLYLEEISDGKKFLEGLRAISFAHPVFILKPGRHSESKKVMMSHTGSIAGEFSVLEAAASQSNAFICTDLEEFFDLSIIFSMCPNIYGKNVCVVSNAGGPGVIISDLLKDFKLNLVPLTSETTKNLTAILPKAASLLNPIDILGDALSARYEQTLETVMRQKDIDAFLVLLTPQTMTEVEQTAKTLIKLKNKHKKPLVAVFIGGKKTEKGVQLLLKNNIPAFKFAYNAVRAISKVVEWQKARETINSNKLIIKQNSLVNLDSPQKIKAQNVFDTVASQKRAALNLFEVHTLFKNYGIPVPHIQKITSFDEALAFAQKFSFPAVLKLSSPTLLHKTEAGAVKINIHTPEALKSSYKEFLLKAQNLSAKSGVPEILIQNQIDFGGELLLGIKKDPNFGFTFLFGAGGTVAELVKDRNLFVLPFAFEEELDALITKSKIFTLLNGFRGSIKYDLTQLKKTMVSLAQIVNDFPQISEIEINPLIINKDGTFAVDGRVLL